MLSIAGNKLSEALKIASQAAAARSPIDILTHLRLQGEAGGTTLAVTGSDISLTVIATVPASIGPDDVDICLPADKLQAVASMGAASVIFTKKDSKVIARAGSCRLTIPALPGGNYPEVKIEGKPTALFDAPGLTALIPTVAFAVAGPKEHARPYLRNLWVESDGTAIHVTASDGAMLASNCLPVATSEFGIPISAEGAELFASIGVEQFQIFERHIVGQRAGVKVICNRPQAKYFEWRRALPNPTEHVAFRREDLLQVCPLHRLFDTKGIVRFEQDYDVCSISITDGNQAVDAELEIKERGEESHLEGAFDGPNLLRLLGQVKTESVLISWADSEKPGAYLLQDGSWRGLLMPLRA
ncbi:hypothetical protein P3W85_29755 [Cupriavidus basilensis]|uniref:Beta sliding clamp n=1 Tax=Cupriavidus basilensis TaxID=68895 RepID=A0ABT6AWZ8_9BURK|nr:hypothetical protein [Cupriavidus basilensis]MDF3837108.1 hypothetical protein [Cupriavidus basilensis]